MEEIVKRHRTLIDITDLRFKRDITNRIPWHERLIGIKGARGIGKTTLLLQYVKENYETKNEALYISLDDPYFYSRTLLDFTDEFVAKGGQHLFIDEVHKYPDWAVEIKKIYDYNPDLKVVFTGSSLLEILNSKADLSRRALSYKMQGLSFREFLEFRYNIRLRKLTLEEILNGHEKLANEIIKKTKPLKYFDEYLKSGYFPFANTNIILFFKQLNEIISLIIDMELPVLRNVEISKTHKVKQLLSVISQSVPFKPNISSLANKINISRNSLLEYIYALVDANILMSIHKTGFGVSTLQKPDKLFIENTNYMYSLLDKKPDTGNLRETFFLNQISESHIVTYPEKGDFWVDNKYLFEIGGKTKSKKQIIGIDNSYTVIDNTETGYENRIPLWLFGFLY